MKANCKKYVLVMLAVLGSINLYAQDPQFSQFNASPLTLNPAMTGVFSGNYRITGIFRSQWGRVLKSESTPMFRTVAASYDMRIALTNTSNDAFGWGLSVSSDKAGAGDYGTNYVSLSMSYLKSLSKKGNNYLTVGLQAGMGNVGFDKQKLLFGDQIINGTSSSIDAAANPAGWYPDISAGLFWYLVQKKRTNYWAGVSIYHVNQPDISGNSFSSSANLPYKISGSAGVQVPVGSQVDLLPSILVMSQGKAFQVNVGSYIKFMFEPNNPQGNAFYIGPWYRIVRSVSAEGNGAPVSLGSDALIIATRFDVSTFSLGFSYDLNFSDLTAASNAQGAFEISAVHIGSFTQKSKVKFCPRF